MMKKYSIFVLLVLSLIFPKLIFAMANPSSVYCVENGGTSEIVSGQMGEYSICKFKDGTECEEWAYYRKECSPGQYTNWASSQSKDPDFELVILSEGWVVDKNNIKYVDESQAKYDYYSVLVQNVNDFSVVSSAVKMVAYGDPVETFTIPPLSAGQKSEIFNVFIPVGKNDKIDLEINPDRSVKETNYINNIRYSPNYYKKEIETTKQKDESQKQSEQKSKLPYYVLAGLFGLTVLISGIISYKKRA